MTIDPWSACGLLAGRPPKDGIRQIHPRRQCRIGVERSITVQLHANAMTR